MSERVFLDTKRIEPSVKELFNGVATQVVGEGYKYFIVMDAAFFIVKGETKILDTEDESSPQVEKTPDKIVFGFGSLGVDEIMAQIGNDTEFKIFNAGVSHCTTYGPNESNSHNVHLGMGFKTKDVRDIVLSMFFEKPVALIEQHLQAADFVDGELKTVEKNIVELKPKGYKLN